MTNLPSGVKVNPHLWDPHEVEPYRIGGLIPQRDDSPTVYVHTFRDSSDLYPYLDVDNAYSLIHVERTWPENGAAPKTRVTAKIEDETVFEKEVHSLWWSGDNKPLGWIFVARAKRQAAERLARLLEV